MPLTRLVALFTIVLLTACGGGGGSSGTPAVPPSGGGGTGGGTGGGGDTGGGGGDDTGTPPGGFSLLVTDAPSDRFQQILVTVSAVRLIGDADGDDGPVVLDDPVQVDLLALDDVASVLASVELTPGTYRKVRLVVSDITLNRLADDGSVLESVMPPLPGNGRIDLKLDDPLVISSAAETVLELDIDAVRSFRFTGNGEVRFRPVLFARELDDDTRGKPVRGHALVDSVDAEAMTFVACRLRGPGASGVADDARCANVVWDAQTSFVAADGSAASADDLIAGAEVGITGFARRGENGLEIAAVSVTFGDRDSLRRIDGTAVGPVADDGTFSLQVDDGEGFADGTTLLVATGDLTRFLGRSGARLDATAVVAGAEVDVEGVLTLSDSAADRLDAVLVIIDDRADDDDDDDRPELRGRIANLDSANSTFDLQRGQASQCVLWTPDTRFATVSETDDGVVVEDATAEALADGLRAEVSGVLDGDCLQAGTVLLLVGDDDDDDDIEVDLELAGIVTAFDPDTGRLDLRRGDASACVLVTSSTEVEIDDDLERDGALAIREGDLAKAEGEALDDGCLVADELKIRPLDKDDDDDDDDKPTRFLLTGVVAEVDAEAGLVVLENDGTRACLLLDERTEVRVRSGRDFMQGSLEDVVEGAALKAGGFRFDGDCLQAAAVVVEREPFAVQGVLADFGPEDSFFVTRPDGSDVQCFVVDEDARVKFVEEDGQVVAGDLDLVQDFFNAPVQALGPEFIAFDVGFEARECLLATDVLFGPAESAPEPS